MPRYRRNTIAYDPRSGWKYDYEDMVPDGENPGLTVAQDMADDLNMQRYPATFFPEGMLRKAFPPNDREHITMYVGKIYEADPSFSLLVCAPAFGGTGGGADFEVSTTVAVTYLGENVTYLGGVVTYTEEL